MRVLVVEDEVKLASLIRRGLREEGLLADVAIKGEDALWMAGSSEYDVIVLDLMLPGIDGLETCRRLRDDGVRTPILILTARGEVSDRIEGLNAGADDYLIKPFAFGELVARLHALARRGEIERPPVLQVDDLRLDPVTHRVWRGDHELDLSAKEFLLLATLMRYPGRAMSRQQLLDHAWDSEYEAHSNVVDVYIRYLRDKVDRPYGRHSIETVRGVGYRLVANREAVATETGSRDLG
jgi:two-component system OmpR family response regulator